MSDDVIRRSDAIKAFTFNSKGERIPFVDCDNFPVEFPLRYIVDTLAALPSADKPSAADLSSVYSTAYKSGYDKGYADAVQGIADELVKQGKHIEVDRPQGDTVSRRYLLAEIDDLADEFSEVDENGLHSERWCGIVDAKLIIMNAPSVSDRPQDREQFGKTEQLRTHNRRWCNLCKISRL